MSIKDLVYFLNQRDIGTSLAIWALMTDGVLEPQKGVDQASYWHDSYGGAAIDPDNRTANKRWIKNAWKRAKGPDQIIVAAVGTIAFSLVNFVHDVTHVRYSQYKPGWKNAPCRKGCNLGSF